MLILYVATIVMAAVLFDAMIKSASAASSSKSGAKEGKGHRETGRPVLCGVGVGVVATVLCVDCIHTYIHIYISKNNMHNIIGSYICICIS